MTILGIDVSHHQGSPDFGKVKASGREFVVIKATEGTTYVDATFAANRRNAHTAGLIVGMYHFARAGNAAAEAAWFVKTIGTLQPGEFLVLDWEVTYAGDHVAWCKAWLDAVTAATGVAPLIYMDQSAMNSHNWMPLSGVHGLWLAKYDGSTAAPTACNCWPTAAMKQYSSTATVPGVAGSCDVNAFYGTREQLLAYGKGGSPAPIPTPTPTVREDDMRVVRTENGTIWLVTDTDVLALSDFHTADAVQKVWGGYTQISAAELDVISRDATARRQRLLTDVQRSVLCNTPSDRTGAWLWDRVAGVDDKTGAISDAVGKAQTGGVDPAEVARLVLAGLNGAQLNVQQAPGK